MQANISEGAYDFVILRSAFMQFPHDLKYPLLEKTFVSRPGLTPMYFFDCWNFRNGLSPAVDFC